MIELIWFVLAVLASPFKSKSRLEADNAVLLMNQMTDLPSTSLTRGYL